MFPTLNSQPFGSLSTVQLLPLGTVMFNPKDQGRTAYKYVQFGGTSAIGAGLLLVAPAAPSNSTGLAISANNSVQQLTAGNPANGVIQVTNGGTAVLGNQFVDGEIMISGGGVIERHRITGNSAESTGTGTILVEYTGSLLNTLVAGTQVVALRQSPAYGTVPSLTQALPVGVTIVPVPNSASVTNFGWVQIYGVAFVQATSATKGYPLVQDTAGTAGYFANTGSNLPMVAIAQETASGSLAPIDLHLI